MLSHYCRSRTRQVFCLYGWRYVTINAHSTIDSAQTISWYPGHIAKAERELADYLRKVDVVIEVRDARIPLSTTHPMVPQWVGNKPLIVAVSRVDQVPPQALKEWKYFYEMHPDCIGGNIKNKKMADSSANITHPQLYFIDSKHGTGIKELRNQALIAAHKVNERRERLGMQPRAIRAAIIGFPNVGKSALINRILGKRKVESRDMPGVTRSMQWVRIAQSGQSAKESIELLDSPGIIPASHIDQHKAALLAICNDIGEASYDRAVIAALMCEKLIELHAKKPTYLDMSRIEERYALPFQTMKGEHIVTHIANKFFNGNTTSAADRLLGDFRKGHLGLCSMEIPPLLNLEKSLHTSSLPRNQIQESGQLADAEKHRVASADSELEFDRAGEKHFSFSVGKGKFDGF